MRRRPTYRSADAAAHLGLGVERRVDLRLDQRDVDAHLAQQRRDDALLLREQRREQVLGRQLLMTAALGERLGLAAGPPGPWW